MLPLGGQGGRFSIQDFRVDPKLGQTGTGSKVEEGFRKIIFTRELSTQGMSPWGNSIRTRKTLIGTRENINEK
jgi:hypothetical protein